MKSYSAAGSSSASKEQFVLPLILFVAVASFIVIWNMSGFSNGHFLILILSPIFFFVSFFFAKTGLVLLVLSMLFSPEIPVGTMGMRIIAIRMEDVMIPVLILAWVARLGIRREFGLLTRSPLNFPIFILLLVSFVATVPEVMKGNIPPLSPIFYLGKTIEFFAIFFLVLNFIRTRQSINLFLFFILLTLALVGIYTLVQVPRVEIFTESRITAPFEGNPEPATIGGYMAFLLLITLSLYLYENRPGLKWLYGVLGVLAFIPFIYTLNRTSYAALLGGLLFIAFIERRRKWLVFIMISLLLASPLWVPKAVKDRIAFTWQDGANEGRIMGVDYSFQARLTVYGKIMSCLKGKPVLGCGVASTENPDSQYARTLYEIGLLGFGIWVWIFVRLFRISRWLFHSLEGGFFKGFVLGYRAGLVGILVHGFGVTTFYIVRIMEPFWFITGLIVSLYLIQLAEVGRQAEA